MTQVPAEPGGDSELAAPANGAAADATPAHVRAPADLEAADVVVRSSNRTVPSTTVLLLAAILVAVLANLILGWLVVSTTSQVRDQSTIANGLQHCLIRAQLAENSTTDPNGTAYKAAVNSCLNR